MISVTPENRQATEKARHYGQSGILSVLSNIDKKRNLYRFFAIISVILALQNYP